MSSSRSALTAMVPSLTDKFRSSDSDLRVMALLDLNKELTRILAQQAPPARSSSSRVNAGDFYVDEVSERVLTERVLALLLDQNAEVKNAAVTCIANMTKKARPPYLRQIMMTITEGIGSPTQKVDEENRDINCLALKSVVAEVSPDNAQLPDCLKIMFSRIQQNVSHANTNPQLASELLQILTDIYVRFPTVITESAELQQTSVANFKEFFSVPRLSIRRRAVPALAAFISFCPQYFGDISAEMTKGFEKGGDSAKAWVTAVAGMAKTPASGQVGTLITAGSLVPEIMRQLSDLNDTDAAEGALTALEVLAIRCPSELSGYVESITASALELIKYDPNYVEMGDDDDDDVDMGDDEDDDDDEFDNDAYSDDDDDSWKIRRSAAKLLQALISTRNDLLGDFYKTVAPRLMARFNEREESVRLEILSSFEALLKQTVNTRSAELTAAGRNKRKRSEEMDQDGNEDTAISSLLDLSPQLIKATLKQASAKTPSTRQQSFVLLRQVVEALDGGLEAEADNICATAEGALRTADSPSLTIAVISFLTAFFSHHSARTYASHLDSLAQALVRSMRDKLQRVSYEAFAAASALAQAMRPNKGSSSPLRAGFDGPVQELFKATTSVLGDSSVDGDVREKALITLGDVLIHEGDALASQLSVALDLITARLAAENTAAAAVEVIGRVADSRLCTGPEFDAWLLQVLPEVVVSLRRNNKRSVSKTSEFETLENIITRIGTTLPIDTADGIIVELKAYLDTPAALNVVALVLQNQPHCRIAVDKNILPDVFHAIKTSSNTAQIKAFTDFFGVYVDGDVDCALRLVPSLTLNLPKVDSLPDATQGGTLAYTTTARCIGAVVQHSQRNLAGILSLFQRHIKSAKSTEPDIYLALLSIGEIGRLDDLSVNVDLLDTVFDFFDHESEEVRSAAAFAAGNMAVGSPDTLLHVLIRRIDNPKSDSERLLLLYSLKEVILHTSDPELDKLTDLMWHPLFSDLGSKVESDDGVRNVKAACIGKLTIAAPGRFIPQLQEMLTGNEQQRALVAASIRYTFIDSSKMDAASTKTDEMIAPIVSEFLSLMKDENAVVRRLAVAALNAAAQSRPHLIIDKLSTLQPYLYKETEIKKELQREVQMGPWKVLEDDGLENRKTAYETMYTLLATCFSRIDLPTFTDRVIAALSDVNEIKILGLMLLLRLAQLAPAYVIPRLDEVAAALKVIMKDLEVKEDTIKQDLERKEEMQRSTLRTAVPLYRMSTAAQAPGFHQFVASLLRSDQWKEYRDYQA